MKLFKMFKRAAMPEYKPTHIDTAALDDSFLLLQSTTADVSNAAIEAAKILQERLNFSEHRFFETIDAIEDFVLIKDGAGRWKTLNKFGQELFRFHQKEYYHKTDDEIAASFPYLKETLDYCQVTDRKAWEMRASSRSEEKIPYPNGTRYLDMIKTPTFDGAGNRCELIIVGRDITELRNQSKRERACFHALNAASDAIVILNKKGDIYFCNDQFIKVFGFTDYNSCVGQNIHDVVKHVSKRMWSTVQKNKLGSVDKFQVSVFPMMNGEPNPIYYVCTFKKDLPATP